MADNDNSVNLRSKIKGLLGVSLWPISQLVAHRIRGVNGLILMFHYVRPPILPGVSEDLFVSRSAFGEMLDLLVQSFHILEPDEFFARMRTGDLPPRATLLTFDDGSVDMVTNALPELLERDLKACFFVCPALVDKDVLPPTMRLAVMLHKAKPGRYEVTFRSDRSPLVSVPFEVAFDDEASRMHSYYQIHPAIRQMHSLDHPAFFDHLAELFLVNESDAADDFRLANWDELQKLVDAGMLVGNHTMSHSTIAADGTEHFRNEVGDAFDRLESFQTGEHKVFCFPYGREEDITPQAVSILRQQDVDFGLATQGGIASLENSSPWALRRESVYHSSAHLRLTPLLASLRK